MNFFSRILTGITTAAALATSVMAQSEQDFINAFAGEWYVFDPAMRQGVNPCALNLSSAASDERLPVTSNNCQPPLSQVDRWSIRDGRIILSTATAETAVMGGNQFRVTGDLNALDTSLVIERAQGDGNSAKIAAALRKHRCYFVGFSQQCAQTSDIKMPEVSDEAGFATIETLANLNARAQPRRDAASIGNIGEGTTVRVNQCLTASDGVWCRARIGDTSAWLAMTALRQDEWPVLTYRSNTE